MKRNPLLPPLGSVDISPEALGLNPDPCQGQDHILEWEVTHHPGQLGRCRIQQTLKWKSQKTHLRSVLTTQTASLESWPHGVGEIQQLPWGAWKRALVLFGRSFLVESLKVCRLHSQLTVATRVLLWWGSGRKPEPDEAGDHHVGHYDCPRHGEWHKAQATEDAKQWEATHGDDQSFQ